MIDRSARGGEDGSMNSFWRLAIFCFLGSGALRGSAPAWGAPGLAQKVCASSERETYPKAHREELRYLCALPPERQRLVPELYWYSPSQYRSWLKGQSEKATAPANYGPTLTEGDQQVNRLVLQPNHCSFYSTISPSVQRGAVAPSPRTKVVGEFADLLKQCRALHSYLRREKAPRCSVVEFAGHSTQSIGLDTVFGIDIRDGRAQVSPSPRDLKKLAACLKKISEDGAPVVFSVCGGDQVIEADGSAGKIHYWPEKQAAQDQLAQVFQRPILSGVGYVDGTPEGGVTSPEGWYHSTY